jgi:hypothetical protein
VPSIGVARCHSVGVVISCGESGSEMVLRAQNGLHRLGHQLVLVAIFFGRQQLLPASRSSTSSG